ncbi:MAG: CDP-glucose 4,6-dehydratase [Clostridiales bacterium]|nr:CDP-glucose 4,6-dehydratase [Clostridiales bacterium]
MDLSIYKNKKVIITGHTGFKGTWLTLILKKLGAEVLGYSLEPNTNPSLFNICNLNNGIKNFYGDIRNDKFLEEVIKEFNPDIIFHLAAQPLVRLSYKNPKLTYETNVIGTLNIYEAARKCSNLKAIVSITADKCYENREWVYGYRENDPMGGYDPYSSSKGCVELLSNSYRKSFFEKEGILLATCRAGNVIGGGDWAEDRLIPDFVRAVSKNEKIIIRNPLATRPWQHVLEPLRGYLSIGLKLLEGDKDFAEGWNFRPNDSDILSVKNVLDESIRIWGKGNYELDKNENPHEAMSLKLDISKAKAKLKWNPKYNVHEAINETINWYKEYYNGNKNMKEYTEKQIEKYFEIEV